MDSACIFGKFYQKNSPDRRFALSLFPSFDQMKGKVRKNLTKYLPPAYEKTPAFSIKQAFGMHFQRADIPEKRFHGY